jgi:hypothetical protein
LQGTKNGSEFITEDEQQQQQQQQQHQQQQEQKWGTFEAIHPNSRATSPHCKW